MSVFFVDLDDTLISTTGGRVDAKEWKSVFDREYAEGPDSGATRAAEGMLWVAQNQREVVIDGRSCDWIVVRPDAIEFLTVLKENGQTCLLSAAGYGWISACLKAAGLVSMFDHVFSSTDVNDRQFRMIRNLGKRANDRWVLFDNHPADYPLTADKLLLIGGNKYDPAHLVKVPAFVLYDDEDVEPLLEAARKVPWLLTTG